MPFSGGFGGLTNVPGIPLAPLGKQLLKASDHDYIERKRKLAPRLPFYNAEEIARRKHPYYIVLLHEMLQAGYQTAVRELAQIFRKEEKTVTKSGVNRFRILVSQSKKVLGIADILRESEEYENGELYETAATIRRELGQNLMKENDVTLAKHFLKSALLIMEKEKQKSPGVDRLKAEIHCLLAFIARESSENVELALESAVNHLTICRNLAKAHSWHFPPHVLSIRLKKPISLHGLRDETEDIDVCSMSLYMIATLLEHEMMLALANQILHSHKYPSDQDIAQAHAFADTALRLAFEVHQPVALSSALLRFGIILRHAAEYDDSIKYFKQLSNHSEVTGDNETFAIAQHNIAMSHMAKHESLQALECLTTQKEIADVNGIVDLQSDALEELGLILLQEGQLWESEECYASAYEGFKSIEHKGGNHGGNMKTYHQHCDRTFGMWGIAAGHQLWSRFAGLARSDTYQSVAGLIDWKCRRTLFPKVPRPNYKADRIEDVYDPYHIEEDDDGEENEGDEDTTSPLDLEVSNSQQSIKKSHSGSSSPSVTSDMVYPLGNLRESGEFDIAVEEYMSDLNHSPEDQALQKELEENSSIFTKRKSSQKRKSRQRTSDA